MNNIDKNNIPKHVAIIMDGNGRWAKEQGFDRIYGHKNGVKSVREVTEAAGEIGIQYLTLYAFSTENWNRPKYEIDALMELLVETIKNEVGTLNKNNVRLNAIGNLNSLPNSCQINLNQAIHETSSNTGLIVTLALSYSARWEITTAVKKILEEQAQNKEQTFQIDEQTIEKYLATNNMPDPELLIRTSGEHRVSNFLLWQIAYSEFYFTDTLWPDFGKENFYKAIGDYQTRERRFGKTSEQL